MHKAIDIRRRLAKDDGTLLPELAEALDEQADSLAELKDYEDAGSCLKEAVGIRRQLTDDDPSELSDLGHSLHNYADCLEKSGKVREAVSVIGEAVKARRTVLAEDRDDWECLDALACSLRAHAAYTEKLGNHLKASSIVQEAIEIQRRLPDDDPSVRGTLAEYIRDAASYEAKLGKHRDAVRIIDEAIDILRQVHNSSTLPDLATSLHNRATYLSELECYGEAVDSVREACDIRQKLARDDDQVIPSLEASKSLLASYQRRAQSRPDHQQTQNRNGEQPQRRDAAPQGRRRSIEALPATRSPRREAAATRTAGPTAAQPTVPNAYCDVCHGGIVLALGKGYKCSVCPSRLRFLRWFEKG